MNVMTTNDLLKQLDKYDLAQSGAEYVRQTLDTEPSREVGQNARKNVVGAYSSATQGLTLQYESHTAELHWILRWELDKDVIGIRDQPPAIQLVKPDKNGIQRRLTYTPDFLLLLNDRVQIVEVKTPSELRKLSKKLPEQWVFEGEQWHFKPAETHFSAMVSTALVS